MCVCVCGVGFSDAATDDRVLVAHACVFFLRTCWPLCMRVRASRVRRPDDAGHHDPPGEEETGLHPRAHPD